MREKWVAGRATASRLRLLVLKHQGVSDDLQPGAIGTTGVQLFEEGEALPLHRPHARADVGEHLEPLTERVDLSLSLLV